MEGRVWVVNSDFSLQKFIEYATELYATNKYVEFKWNTGKQRSEAQNNSLHLYCANLADDLNDAGLDMRKVLKPEVEIPWTKDSAKKNLWNPIQDVMFSKKSSADAYKTEFVVVYNVLSKNLSEKFNITTRWPGEKDNVQNKTRFSNDANRS